MKNWSLLLLSLVVSSSICFCGQNPFAKSEALINSGEFAKAVKNLEKFASKNPQDQLAPAALFTSANISLLNLNQPERARQNFQRITQNYPRSKWAVEAYRRLGEIALKEARYQEASDYFLNGLKNSSGADFEMPLPWMEDVANKCAEALNKIENPQTQISAYSKIVDYMPHGETKARAKLKLAYALEASGKENEAAGVLVDMLYAYPTSRSAGEVIEKKRELVNKFCNFPWEALTEFSKARTALTQSDYQNALTIFKGLMETYPGTGFAENAEFGYILSTVLQNNDFESAIDSMRSYVEKFRNGYRAREAEERMQSWSDILNLQQELSIKPEDYDLNESIGFQLLRGGFYGLAEKHFQIASKNPASSEAYLGLGYLYNRMGNPERAAENFQIYLNNHPNEGYLFNTIGYIYLQLQQFDRALGCFQRYMELEPDNPNSHDSYAEGLMNLGRMEEAIAEYKKAIEIDPAFTNPYYMLGEIYKNLNDSQTALKYYRQYLELDPNGTMSQQAQANIDALNNK